MMKKIKILIGMFLLSITLVVVGVDFAYANPGGPVHDETSIPIRPIPIRRNGNRP